MKQKGTYSCNCFYLRRKCIMFEIFIKTSYKFHNFFLSLHLHIRYILSLSQAVFFFDNTELQIFGRQQELNWRPNIVNSVLPVKEREYIKL